MPDKPLPRNLHEENRISWNAATEAHNSHKDRPGRLPARAWPYPFSGGIGTAWRSQRQEAGPPAVQCRAGYAQPGQIRSRGDRCGYQRYGHRFRHPTLTGQRYPGHYSSARMSSIGWIRLSQPANSTISYFPLMEPSAGYPTCLAGQIASGRSCHPVASWSWLSFIHSLRFLRKTGRSSMIISHPENR